MFDRLMTYFKIIFKLYSLPIFDFTLNSNVLLWFCGDLFHRNLGSCICVKYTIKVVYNFTIVFQFFVFFNSKALNK